MTVISLIAGYLLLSGLTLLLCALFFKGAYKENDK